MEMRLPLARTELRRPYAIRLPYPWFWDTDDDLFALTVSPRHETPPAEGVGPSRDQEPGA